MMCISISIIPRIILLIFFIKSTFSIDFERDENGYIVYCPCMGRFGNQADMFLGALAFAHDLNRTLVLPPWVEYRREYKNSLQIPFNTYFQVEPLKKYHRVILMEDFMRDLAPIIWPREERAVFCYVSRGDDNSCHAKEGNPFGPFWDTFNIDFVKSEMYEPLNYDTRHNDMAKRWNERYPANEFPVLAFVGPPASFPVQKENKKLQKYFLYNNIILKKAHDFIKDVLPVGPFVGIHLRNGKDWTLACKHIENSPNMFATPQCLGYNLEHGKGSHEICFPSKEAILSDLRMVLRKINSKTVFVSSDHDHMIQEIEVGLKDMDVKAFKCDLKDPHVDLAILGLSNHFIGNCVSTFTSFARRSRDVLGLPSSFWQFPFKKNRRDEL